VLDEVSNEIFASQVTEDFYDIDIDESAREALALEISNDKDFLHIDDDDASLFSPQQPQQKRARLDFSITSSASPNSMLNHSHNRRKTPHLVNRFI
jgi:hypothetical protein